MKGNQAIKGVSPEEFTAAYIRILNWFFSFPEREFSFNDVCEQTKTSKVTAKLVIQDLEKRGVLSKTIFVRVWHIKANMGSLNYIRAKIAYNLDRIYGTNLVDFVLNNYPQLRAIVLFGSFRKGEDISTSDLDIAIEVPGTPQMKIETLGFIDKIDHRQNIKVNIHIFSRENVDLNVFANIANGIVLHGFLEVRP